MERDISTGDLVWFKFVDDYLFKAGKVVFGTRWRLVNFFDDLMYSDHVVGPPLLVIDTVPEIELLEIRQTFGRNWDYLTRKPGLLLYCLAADNKMIVAKRESLTRHACESLNAI